MRQAGYCAHLQHCLRDREALHTSYQQLEPFVQLTSQLVTAKDSQRSRLATLLGSEERMPCHNSCRPEAYGSLGLRPFVSWSNIHLQSMMMAAPVQKKHHKRHVMYRQQDIKQITQRMPCAGTMYPCVTAQISCSRLLLPLL